MPNELVGGRVYRINSKTGIINEEDIRLGKMNKPEMKTGDVVRLKSGGKLMTVSYLIHDKEEDWLIVCNWHNDNGDGWQAKYFLDELEPVFSVGNKADNFERPGNDNGT